MYLRCFLQLYYSGNNLTSVFQIERVKHVKRAYTEHLQVRQKSANFTAKMRSTDNFSVKRVLVCLWVLHGMSKSMWTDIYLDLGLFFKVWTRPLSSTEGKS